MAYGEDEAPCGRDASRRARCAGRSWATRPALRPVMPSESDTRRQEVVPSWSALPLRYRRSYSMPGVACRVLTRPRQALDDHATMATVPENEAVRLLLLFPGIVIAVILGAPPTASRPAAPPADLRRRRDEPAPSVWMVVGGDRRSVPASGRDPTSSQPVRATNSRRRTQTAGRGDAIRPVLDSHTRHAWSDPLFPTALTPPFSRSHIWYSLSCSVRRSSFAVVSLRGSRRSRR
jgi:hypothetical protein